MNQLTPRRSALRSFAAASLACGAALAGLACGPALAGWSGDIVKGNGTIRTQERPLGHFEGVELSLPAQVEVRLGNTESVSIETDENLLPMVETRIDNGSLKLRYVKRNLTFDASKLKIVVNAKTIRQLSIGGSGSIDAPTLKAPKLEFEVGGAGTLRVGQLQSDSVHAEIGGSGNMELGGSTRKLSVSLGGSGHMRAPQLKADDVDVSVGGSGSATVWAVSGLSAAIAGSGGVDYWGDPRTTASVAGSGAVRRLGSAPR